MHVLPALALLSTFLIHPQLGVVINAVLSLDGWEADSTTLLNAPVLWNQDTPVFSGEDVAAIGKDISTGLLLGLFAGLNSGAFFFDFGRKGDKVYPTLVRFRNNNRINEGIQRH